MITLARFNQKKLDIVKSLLADGVDDATIRAAGYSKSYIAEAVRQNKPAKCFHNASEPKKRCKCGALVYESTVDFRGYCYACNMRLSANIQRDWRRQV
ncbi:hypothetical protein VN12_04105 [Pirellula sp. SH-Sr6A]|uniref:hypothetical protein n=1 Tax=Pirellula sp. SH-Sr6A TaxID=1632865 RepID=UPI00078B4406|nr:hypothetical protein [Pirellula sp. SH-Sr6A]AMV31276.1 hypothetical protein VN12_04105 [Pirellula sp. SH-Sr6A]